MGTSPSLEEIEYGLVGVFNIVMDEEASFTSIDNKSPTLPKKDFP